MNVEGFAACLTDDWREAGPRGPEAGFGTLEDERRTMELHRRAFPDKHTEIHRIVTDDETVACHCTVAATHTETYLDLEPTGKQPSWTHQAVFEHGNRSRWAVKDSNLQPWD